MIKIFRAAERRFEQNPGRIDGFRLASGRNADSELSYAEQIASERTNASGGNGSNAGDFGAGSLNFDVRRLDPGELSSLYHFHRHAEELFMIVEGEVTLRTPEGLQILRAGDIAFFGTGADGAHQLYNHSAAPCIYLDVRTFLGADIAEYPDSGRLLVVPTMERFDKSASNGYFDGEPDAAETREKFKRPLKPNER